MVGTNQKIYKLPPNKFSFKKIIKAYLFKKYLINTRKMGAWFTSEMYIWQNFGTFQLNFPPSHLSKYDISWNLYCECWYYYHAIFTQSQFFLKKETIIIWGLLLFAEV